MSDHPADSDCIFCKIVAGDIPCWKIYEDDHVLSFLDVGPLSQGHTLIIPKGHWVTLDQVPEDIVASIGRVVHKVGQAVSKATGCPGWNVLQNNGVVAGQVVNHVHFHIIPRTEDDGLGYRWPAGSLDEADAKGLQQKIADRL